MSASWRTQRDPELDSGTIQLVVDTSVVPRHPRTLFGDPTDVNKMDSRATHENDSKLLVSCSKCHVTLKRSLENQQNKSYLFPGFPDLRSENDGKLNVPSSTGGRLDGVQPIEEVCHAKH